MSRQSISLLDWCKTNNKQYIIDEWDEEENSSLGFYIDKIASRSNKAVNWKCSKGHKWEQSPDKRTMGSRCPYCSGRKVLAGDNDLATTHPSLILDWDFEKNEIKPDQVTKISTKEVYWRCNTCGHRWKSLVRERAVYGSGCFVCALSKRGEKKHQTELNNKGHFRDKELLLDWDWEANYPKTPEDYTPVSNKRVNWKCHICGYKWKAKLSNRVHGRGCPCCSNKVVVKGVNDLATKNPALAKEWHPTKNGDLKPDMVTPGTGRKVFWLCPIGHTYQATVLHRSYGTKCPICNSGRQTSFAEQAVFYYIKKEFPDSISRYKPEFLKRMELDIYIPSRKTAIEYDGAAWHGKDKLKREQRKYKLCHERGIELIRVRESFPEMGADIADYMFGNNDKLYEFHNLDDVIFQLIKHLTYKMSFQICKELSINTKRDEQKILNYKEEITKGSSFADKYPDLAKEWHPTKNGDLKPSMFMPHSDFGAWWICSDCSSEYYATIGHRSYGTSCPECGRKRGAKKRCVPVEMIDIKTGEIIKTFDSINEASEEMKINRSNISMVCKGNSSRTQAGGYRWRYAKKKK